MIIISLFKCSQFNGGSCKQFYHFVRRCPCFQFTDIWSTGNLKSCFTRKLKVMILIRELIYTWIYMNWIVISETGALLFCSRRERGWGKFVAITTCHALASATSVDLVSFSLIFLNGRYNGISQRRRFRLC